MISMLFDEMGRVTVVTSVYLAAGMVNQERARHSPGGRLGRKTISD
jgi:hypothetical protein